MSMHCSSSMTTITSINHNSQKQQSNAMVDQATPPNDYDVLMGQSPNLRLHPGNKRLKELVAKSFNEYFHQRTSKLDKTFIAKGIIQTILDKGGRFLKQPEKKRVASIKDAVWVEERNPVRIRDKVASQFRGHLKELKRRKYSDDETHSCANKSKEQQIGQREETDASIVPNLPLKKRKLKFDSSTSDSRYKREYGRVFQQNLKAFKHKDIEMEPAETDTRKLFPMYDKYEMATEILQIKEQQENQRVENILSHLDAIENLRRYYSYGNSDCYPNMQRVPVDGRVPLNALYLLHGNSFGL